MLTFKKIVDWIGKHIKLVLIFVGIIFTIILTLVWRYKNNKIKELKCQLFIAQSKIQIADLAKKYAVSMAQFMLLRQKDKELDSKLNKIEKDLAEKVDPDMTIEEVAKKFREMGVKP